MSEAGDPATPLVDARSLRASFGDHVVFEDVSFSVPAGSVTAIIGPSGSGKSTMLRCINRLESPDAGSIVVAGVEYAAGTPLSADAERALHRSVGMVFQSFNLFPHLSALDNVALALRRVLGLSKAAARAAALARLDEVGLADRAEHRPAQLSGGQQQRVAIARALALDPQVLLLDEPTSSLDPELRSEVLVVLRRLADAGNTMVLVTHEMRFARQVADEVLVMADGRLVERGTAAQVFDIPRHARTQRFLRAVGEP
ncbi:amino acid ABC transporter ATP-binding protein [Microbacterium saperdae]